MLKLKKKMTLRIPDRIAITAVLALIITVAVGMPGNHFGFDDEQAAYKDARVEVPVRAEKAKASTQSAEGQEGFELRLLLFRLR
jgi:hypothetical protein